MLRLLVVGKVAMKYLFIFASAPTPKTQLFLECDISPLAARRWWISSVLPQSSRGLVVSFKSTDQSSTLLVGCGPLSGVRDVLRIEFCSYPYIGSVAAGEILGKSDRGDDS